MSHQVDTVGISQDLPQRRSNLSRYCSLGKRRYRGISASLLQTPLTFHWWSGLHLRNAVVITPLESSTTINISPKLTVGQPVSAMKNLGLLLNREAGWTLTVSKKLATQPAALSINCEANQACTLDIYTERWSRGWESVWMSILMKHTA